MRTNSVYKLHLLWLDSNESGMNVNFIVGYTVEDSFIVSHKIASDEKWEAPKT